ncbi:Translation initiation factor 2 [Mucinivorans hirudinis]|uniref:Translation initiation factor IF-2 n=1 Tax=Mucinivorans hirudinis TaxID=1433126 RepID=A0A060RBE5_9BACT|nr:Translation initiation factor 2 [Mucinivorans hirudinis]
MCFGAYHIQILSQTAITNHKSQIAKRMSEQRKIRLSGVAREYNVGIGTIIDFLAKKGVAIEHNPNAPIEGKALDLVRAEFGTGKIEKVNIREKIRTEQQSVRLEDKVKNPSSDDDYPIEKEVIIKSNAIFTPEVEHLSGPKILGKIDLNKPKAAPQPVAQPKPAQPKPMQQEQKPKIEPQSSQPKPKVEQPQQPKPVVAQPPRPSVQSPAKVSEQPKLVVQPPQPKVDSAKLAEPARDPRISESGVFRANEPEKLSGPTVLGKIELPVARPSSGRNDEKRGKRNRIKKNKVDVAAVGSAQQQGGGDKNKRQGGAGGNQQGGGGHSHNQNRGGGAGNQQGGNQQGGQGNKKRGGSKLPPRPVLKAEVSDEEVQKQIKETLARLTSKGSKSKGAKYRRDKRDAVGQRIAEEAHMQQMQSNVLQVTEFVTVSELATMMDVNVNQVIMACMNLGLMVSINQRLDAEALAIVAEEFGYKVEFVSVEIQEAIESDDDSPEDLVSRPPIVTVMGHVDHGKTSLLDYIRKANVIAGEAGGITQHIGAYSVKMDDGRRITFLDTPGHEAFTAMRARGAKITDVAIIIVAADDAVMPQTIEAINHASAAGVPMIFAINKIDKAGANSERIREQLANMNYLLEDWGGKYQSQEIAAKSGLNVEHLLEKIVLEADMLDLKANPNRKASGSIIESTLDKGRGYVTTVLVQNGTLRVGDVMLAGIYTGRVKAMFNERGKKISEAPPATPVLVLGLNGAPQAGDLFNVMDDDKQAREIATKREQLQRMQGLRTQKHITLDEIGRRIAIGSFKELNIIVKGDVDGSIEALTDSLLKLSTEEVQVNVIHKAVGQISESDVLLAAASNAIIVGFQVRPSSAARKLAEKEEIDVRLYSVIYDAINEVKDAIEGMLAPETKEEILCSVEVIETFKISKVGTVAGCMVREGKITRNTKIRVIRDGIVVYTGRLGSLKRFKDDVKEVNTGLDCGLNIDNFNDIKVGDFIEGYEMTEVARKLS